MHELAVTENILDIAIRHGEQARAKKVTQIHITIGQLSSIVDDSVQFYWDIMSKDTICGGAELVFNRIPASFSCLQCGSTYVLEDGLSPCPQCGSSQVRITSGEEFYLDSIEIETEEIEA